MSRRRLDYFFWMNSDWAYLGADRLEALAIRQDLSIRYRPVDLPAVYARTGGTLLGQRAPERQAYRITELARWCGKLGLHVNPLPAHMCPNADLASRVVIAADLLHRPVARLYKAILHAEWCDDLDISDEQVLVDVCKAEGFEVRELMAAAHDPATETLYRRYTDDAVAAGVFGSPSYVFNGELFWGQDRLEMLEEAVARDTAP